MRRTRLRSSNCWGNKMSEQTRAEYDAKYALLTQCILELEDERDALVLSKEDQEFYSSRLNPVLRDLTKLVRDALRQRRSHPVSGKIFGFSNQFSKNLDEPPVQLRIAESYTVTQG